MARRIQLVNSHGRTEIRLDCGRTFGSVSDLCTHRALKKLDHLVIKRIVDKKPFDPAKTVDLMAMLVIAHSPGCATQSIATPERDVDGPLVVESMEYLLEYSLLGDSLCELITMQYVGRYARLFMLWYGGQLQARGVPLE